MRLTLMLREKEREALLLLSEQERRDPREQAAWIIQHELEQRGLLPAQPGKGKSLREMPEEMTL